MRRQPENNAWQHPEAVPNRGDRADKASQEKDPNTTDLNVGASPDEGPEANGNKKLEDLHDREDLSERQLSNRNWL
jgi:hypothetical protein